MNNGVIRAVLGFIGCRGVEVVLKYTLKMMRRPLPWNRWLGEPPVRKSGILGTWYIGIIRGEVTGFGKRGEKPREAGSIPAVPIKQKWGIRRGYEQQDK